MDQMDRTGRANRHGAGWWPRAWPLVLALFIALCYATVARLPLDRIERAIEFPYQLDGEEGFLLAQAMRLAHGQGLYGSLDHPPYVVDNYPPLYPAVWSLWFRLTRRDAVPSLAAGRLISGSAAVLAALLVAALVAGGVASGKTGAICDSSGAVLRSARGGSGAVLRPARGSSGAALRPACDGSGAVLRPACGWLRPAIAGLLSWACAVQFLTEFGTVHWMAYARVDLPAVALSLAGLALFAWHGRRTDPAGAQARVAAAVLIALGLLTKQTMLAAPTACVLWLLAARRWCDAIRMAASLALAVGLPTLVFIVATHGGYWRHTVTYNQNVMNWNELTRVWAPHLWRFHAPGIVAAALLLLWSTVRLAVGTREDRRCKVGQASCPSLPEKGPSGDETREAPVSRSDDGETGGGTGRMPVLLSDASDPVLRLLTIYAALNVLSLVAIAKAGSAENYLIEPAAAVIAFVGVAMGRLLTASAGASNGVPGLDEALAFARPTAAEPSAGGPEPSTRRARFVLHRLARAAFVAAAAALVLAQAIRYTSIGTDRLAQAFPLNARLAARSGAAPTAEALVQGDRVVRWLRGLPEGPVLCEDPIYLLRAGRPVYFQNFIMTQLAAEGKWDETPVVQAAAQGRIVGVVSHPDLLHAKPDDFLDRWSPALRAAIRQSYRLTVQLPPPPNPPRLYLYEPAAARATAQ